FLPQESAVFAYGEASRQAVLPAATSNVASLALSVARTAMAADCARHDAAHVQSAVRHNPMSGPDLSIEASPEPGHARRGGRAGKRRGTGSAFEQPPFRQLTVPFQPTEIVSADELEAIHLASLRVLEEIGLEVLHDEARAIMKRHGADVREGSLRV